MAYFLTADGGTESIRARVYDVSGKCLASVAKPYKTDYKPGKIEQDPEDWWNSFVVAARGAISESGVAPSQIVAICYATTSCTVVALDADGRALRPAIMWMDVRAHEEANAVLETGDEALELNGAGKGPVSAEWMLPKALWLKRHESHIYNSAFRICEYQDFMTYRLTGEWAASLDNVGLRWHYRNRQGGWAKGILSALDMEELEQKWPERIVAPGGVIGPLTYSAASTLGLLKSVKVIQGGADALIGMIGLGVYKPGQLAMITGSSHLQFGVTKEPIYAHGVWGSYADIVYPDRWIVEGGQTSTGSILNWLSRICGGKIDYDELNRRASALAPGCDGLIVQDHFQGNRTPHTDPLSRGAFVGLTIGHEIHHLFRAVMEGIGFGTRAIIDSFRDAGYESTAITVGGGASASDLWLQIHADTVGLPIQVPHSPDAPSTGSAVLAGVGSGHFKTIDEGISVMVQPGRIIEPNRENMALYEDIYQRYCALYPALKNVFSS